MSTGALPWGVMRRLRWPLRYFYLLQENGQTRAVFLSYTRALDEAYRRNGIR